MAASISGYANDAYRVEVLRAGFTAHMQKPVAIDTPKAILFALSLSRLVPR